MRKALSLCVLALALAVPAKAADVTPETTLPSSEARVPNFIGATGLLLAPSAYTVGDRSASAYFAGSAKPDFIGGGVLVGITRRFEIGGSVVDFRHGDTDFLLNAKFNVLEEKKNWPAISVGVIDATDSLNVDPSWYVVASKYFTRAQTDQRFALKGHLGYGGGAFDDEIFAGAELFFKPNLSLIAEFVNDDVNVGGRFHWKAFTGTLGLFDFDRLGGQVTYNVHF